MLCTTPSLHPVPAIDQPQPVRVTSPACCLASSKQCSRVALLANRYDTRGPSPRSPQNQGTGTPAAATGPSRCPQPIDHLPLLRRIDEEGGDGLDEQLLEVVPPLPSSLRQAPKEDKLLKACRDALRSAGRTAQDNSGLLAAAAGALTAAATLAVLLARRRGSNSSGQSGPGEVPAAVQCQLPHTPLHPLPALSVHAAEPLLGLGPRCCSVVCGLLLNSGPLP
jgi:hypothetical protein